MRMEWVIFLLITAFLAGIGLMILLATAPSLPIDSEPAYRYEPKPNRPQIIVPDNFSGVRRIFGTQQNRRWDR